MEDFEFCRRAKSLGRIAISSRTVLTSARRWERKGLWPTTVTNQLAIAAYYLGVSPNRIARWYGR
jgi:hypothetical protein